MGRIKRVNLFASFCVLLASGLFQTTGKVHLLALHVSTLEMPENCGSEITWWHAVFMNWWTTGHSWSTNLGVGQSHVEVVDLQVFSIVLADLEGRVPGARPPRVQILSFRHTKFSKRSCLGSPCPPPPRDPSPSSGNSGSATALSTQF